MPLRRARLRFVKLLCQAGLKLMKLMCRFLAGTETSGCTPTRVSPDSLVRPVLAEGRTARSVLPEGLVLAESPRATSVPVLAEGRTARPVLPDGLVLAASPRTTSVPVLAEGHTA